jgi:hypothetical protein
MMSRRSTNRVFAALSEPELPLRHTPGIIALVALARERGLDTVYVPAIDAREAVRPSVSWTGSSVMVQRLSVRSPPTP